MPYYHIQPEPLFSGSANDFSSFSPEVVRTELKRRPISLLDQGTSTQDSDGTVTSSSEGSITSSSKKTRSTALSRWNEAQEEVQQFERKRALALFEEVMNEGRIGFPFDHLIAIGSIFTDWRSSSCRSFQKSQADNPSFYRTWPKQSHRCHRRSFFGPRSWICA